MMRAPTLPALAALLPALLLAGCQAWHGGETAEAEVVLPPEPAPACDASLQLQPPVLRLPRTDAPKRVPRDKNAPSVDISQIHTVNRPLQDIGVWSETAGGWSVLTLQLGSERARSLAVRLHDVHLPKGGALWLCSVDGKLRAGPYVQKPDGELWSEPVAASQARLEVWAPTARRAEVGGLLADVYGGYR